jgi:ABC transporter substrate binding protein
LVAELVRRPVAAIASNSVAALVAKTATTTIPIVFQSGVDPVGIGLVSSLGHPGGNVTGVSFFASTMEAKKLEIMHELMPPAALIGLLVNTNNPQLERLEHDVQTAGRVLGRRILIVRAGKQADFQAAFATLTDQDARALVVAGDPFLNSIRKDLIALAAHHAIPTIFSNRENVDDGGLISYASNLSEAYRQVGIYRRILKGEKPSELPVLQPGDGSDQGLEDSARSRRHAVRILPADVRIGFCARCGATEGGIIHGSLCREPQATIDEEPTQHGRDGFFPVVRIFRGPPMADAVVAVSIFQQHFPSMLAM